MCTRWSDEEYIAKRWVNEAERMIRLVANAWWCSGEETFDVKYKAHGLETIWGWDAESGILPCRVGRRGSASVLGGGVLSGWLCCSGVSSPLSAGC
jgi:hypothetical protein